MVLRNAYDVFLLSKKTNAKDAVHVLSKLTNPLNCFLAACYEVFNNVDSLEYTSNTKVDSYLSIFNSQFSNREKTKRQHNRIRILLRVKLRLIFLYKCTFRKEYRSYLSKRVLDKIWHTR